MTKDRYERKAYRRSPGRQYGYDYNPLRKQPGASSQQVSPDAPTLDDRWLAGGDGGRSDIQLAQRPDPRRTRQLLRRHILAGKARSAVLHIDDPAEAAELESDTSPSAYQEDYVEQEDSAPARNRYLMNAAPHTLLPPPRRQLEEAEVQGEWDEFDFADPDTGYEDPLDRRLAYRSDPSGRLAAPPQRAAALPRRPADEYQYDDEVEYYEDEQDQPRARRRSRKRGLTRRKLLAGLGLAAGGVAAYELGPRVPQAISDVGSNLEHQLQDAYNKGLIAGANAVRKEFISGLDNLEGYSLGAAINVAKLTRMTYDAFVSPIITLAATITGNFLTVTLQALQSARGFLSKFNQDNDTLNALQTVLETWIKSVHDVPQEWQTISDTDLDGAQGYLRALQRKIQDEQAKLNSNAPPAAPKTTPTPHTH
jgi:hypothetical protein